MDGLIDTVISRRLDAAEAAEDISAISAESWRGEGADAAKSAIRTLRARAEKLYDNMSVLLQALSTAQDGIGDVQTLVHEARSRADFYGFAIADDGSEVTDPQLDSWWERLGANIAAGQSSQYATELAARRQALEDCAAQVSDALQRADDVDRIFCKSLAQIADDAVTSHTAAGSGPLPGLPRAHPSTEEAAIWWDSLTDDEQADYIKSHPDIIGSLDGVDGWARDMANRHLMSRDLDEARAR